MHKEYRSDAFAAIHETMEGLHEIGVISDEEFFPFQELVEDTELNSVVDVQ
ncbi:hypothetical protein D3C81_1414510 [compost metagenome]